MKQVLLMLSSCAFITLWVISVIFYMPACIRLRSLMDSVDDDGIPTLTRIKSSIKYSYKTFENSLISLPTSDKYLKHTLIAVTVRKIRIYRSIVGVALFILIISVLVLLANI
jgi:hypothetical protein